MRFAGDQKTAVTGESPINIFKKLLSRAIWANKLQAIMPETSPFLSKNLGSETIQQSR